MDKLGELKTTQDIVHEVLKSYEKARNSDNYLYYHVCAIFGKQHGVDIESMSMPMFFLHMKDIGFPAFETVRRTRQKIQAEYPELSGNSIVKGQRKKNEVAFREYVMKR